MKTVDVHLAWICCKINFNSYWYPLRKSNPYQFFLWIIEFLKHIKRKIYINYASMILMLNRNDETCKSHSKYFRVIFRHDHDKLFMETKYLKSTKGKHIVLCWWITGVCCMWGTENVPPYCGSIIYGGILLKPACK